MEMNNSQRVEAKVVFHGRTSSGCEKFMYFAYFACLCVSLILGFVMIGSKNTSIISPAQLAEDPTLNNCGMGLIHCAPKLVEEIVKCQGSKRMLMQASGYDHPDNATMFGVFETYPAIPTLSILGTIGIAVAWILFMKSFARPTVWITLFIKLAFYVALGFFFMDQGLNDQGVYMFIFAACLAALFYYHREKFKKAGDFLEVACTALKERPSIFAATGVIQVVYLVYLGLYCYFVTRAPAIFEVTESCIVMPALWGSKGIKFLTLMLVWTTYFAKGAEAVIVSMTVGSWYFNQTEDVPSSPSFHALKVSMTSSGGAITIGSLITTICERIMSAANSKLWWTNPLGCVLKCVLIALRALIEALTRLSLVMHGISGLHFFDSAKETIGLMKKHLVQALATEYVGRSIVELGAWVFSLFMGITVWYAVDDKYGWDTLKTSSESIASWDVLFYVTLIMFVWLTKYPMMSIFILALIEDISYLKGAMAAPFCGLFSACVTHIILSFVGNIVLFSMDTVFICNALAKEEGMPEVEGRQDMYLLLNDITGSGTASYAQGGSQMVPQAVAVKATAPSQYV